jgi:Flp pilus assembly protein TadG
MKWPEHKASLHLTHNQHLAYYMTVEESIKEQDFGYADDCWVNAEQKAKAITTNECWTLQWYPETPVGFSIVSGADLDVVIAAANSNQ